MADIDWSKLALFSGATGGLEGVGFTHGVTSRNGVSRGELTFQWDETRYTDGEVRDAKQRVLNLLKRGGITILNVSNPSPRQLDIHIPAGEATRFNSASPRRELPPR